MDEQIIRAPIDYALAYAKKRGWRVFPLHSFYSGECSCGRDSCSSPGKHPRTQYGVKEATTDERIIRGWWEHWPLANIGIATGHGLLVGDFDLIKGADIDALRPFGIEQLTETLTALTGSKGYHYYWSTPEDLGNTAGKIGPNIDTRGEGGYVVAPPGFNKNGQYSWLTPALPMATITPELLAFLKGERVKHPKKTQFFTDTRMEQNNEISRHTQRAGETSETADEAQRGHDSPASSGVSVGAAQPSSVLSEARNTFLVGLAGVLRTRGLAVNQISAALLAINQTRYGEGQHREGPLPEEEIERTILKSAAKWEAAEGILHADLPQVIRLQDLMGKVLPDPIWVVKDFLGQGLAILGGKPKIGKSWLMLDLALTCALGTANGGGKVLGQYEVEPSHVLYLSLEDTARRFQSRVKKLLKGRPVPEKFGYALNWKPLHAGGLHDLDTYLTTAPDTRLVVIDTLAVVRPPSTGKGTLYQEEYQFMRELKALADRHNIVLVLVHHLRKSESEDSTDEFSGSTGLTGSADTLLKLKSQRGQQEMLLEVKGRDVGLEELAVRFDKERCTWSALGNVAEHQQSQARQEILDLLREHEAMTPAEIAKELGKERTNVKALLFKMTKDGVVVSSSGGRYTLAQENKAE